MQSCTWRHLWPQQLPKLPIIGTICPFAKVRQKDYKILSIYKIYGRILTQALEAPPPRLTPVVSSTNFISLADLKSPSKALDWTRDQTDDFWFHQDLLSLFHDLLDYNYFLGPLDFFSMSIWLLGFPYANKE